MRNTNMVDVKEKTKLFPMRDGTKIEARTMSEARRLHQARKRDLQKRKK